jgi:hypothetical protein
LNLRREKGEVKKLRNKLMIGSIQSSKVETNQRRINEKRRIL